MVLSIGILLLLSLVLSAVLTGISNWLEQWLIIPAFVWQLGDLTISFGLVTLLFALIYRFLPDVKIAWSDVWMGSAITVGSAYGAAGSFVIILLWVFDSAQILLFGA